MTHRDDIGSAEFDASQYVPEEARRVLEVVNASERLEELMDPTPLEHAPIFSAEIGANVLLKREDTTLVHSFKQRGAFNKIAQLSEEERQKGVITASAGNHAQGVALSASRLGIDATIVMPRSTPPIKVRAVEAMGAEIVLHGDFYNNAYDHSQEIAETSGKVFIHPFDDPEVIAGQGTIGKEILEQNPGVSHIFVPIGGGGLIAGIAQYIKPLRPDIQIIGVQAEESNAMEESLKVGERVTLPHVGTFSEGTAVPRVGEHTFELVQQYVDDIISVDNYQISAAIETFYNETRGILEGAGALAIAGIREYAAAGNLTDDSLAVAICSGANMPMRKLQFVAEQSEIGSGREAFFAISLPERPGALLELCKSVVNGHNISELMYRRKQADKATIFVGFQMTDADDRQRFTDKLAHSKYAFLDISEDKFATQYGRHMIGGSNEFANNELLYEFAFPERPGALIDFLESVGSKWNISLFHYRSLGSDISRVLIGFEDAEQAELERALRRTVFECEAVPPEAAELFL